MYAHHLPFPQKVVMGTTHKNLGLLGHKNHKKEKQRKKKADFSFVVHQYDQVASLSIKRLPLNFDENVEVH